MSSPWSDSFMLLPVMTVDEVAELLRVNRKTVYDMVKRKKIPGCRKVGQNLRFSREVVMRWLAGENDDG